jgi:hypothetical protein
MIVELLESSELVDFVYMDSMPRASDYKAVVDWTQDNAPMDYDIEPYWKAPYDHEDCKWATSILEGVSKPITFYPYTLGSNPNNEHEKYVRSPKEDWWLGLFKAVKEAGGQPIVLGGEKERIDWGSTDVIEAYTDNENWRDNIPLLYYIHGHVGIASWPWQLTHYYNVVNTCVIWINNQFWIDRSIAEDTSKLHIFQTVPSYKEIIDSLGVLK